MNVMLLHSLGALSLCLLSSSALAQAVDEHALDDFDKSSPVTAQPLREPPGAIELRAAMRRIAQSPNDADALADAGNASLTLGDANAALNFFTRANALRPNNGKILSGLAVATVRTENPFEALRLFDDAVRLGISERAIAADRALAFDLLGNFDRAQQDYTLARSASVSDDLIIRQAISLSLAGKKGDADAMLVPLLQKNSISAWRARAFMLAARGDLKESTKVTQGFLDAGSAQRMERYLRLMPNLTGAQQAAAIHLGHFPASQYVGRDSEQVRRVAANIPPAQAAQGEQRLIPSGVPLGPKDAKAAPVKADRKAETKRERKAREQEEIKQAVAKIPEAQKLPKTDRSRLGTETAKARVAEAQASRVAAVSTGGLPPPETARPLVSVSLPQRVEPASQKLPSIAAANPPGQPALAAPAISNSPAPSASTPIVAAMPPAATDNSAAMVPMAAPATSAPVMQGPRLDNTPIIASSPPAAVTTTALPASQAVTPAFDLAAVVSSIQIPESEQKPSATPVDLKKIKPVLPKSAAVDPLTKSAKVDTKTAAKAKPEPAHPARFWVQIATGEANALGFDYRKWAKKNADLFKGQSGWTSAWGKTSRLLVGPFADQKAAKKWEGDFKKAGGDGFMWKSENGVAVTALKSK
jgi:Flp pilus assembly protein TadD